MELKKLLKHVINFLNEEQIYFGKTKLIQLLYLIEIEYYSTNRKRLTELNWIYYKYGPYAFEIEKSLEDNDFVVNEYKEEYIDVRLNEHVKIEDIHVDIKLLIRNTVRKFGMMKLSDLLNYIYFETEPMLKAQNRKEILDFSIIKDEKYYRVKKLHYNNEHEKIINDIIVRYKND